MGIRAVITLSLLGAAAAGTVDYILRKRPRHVRLIAGSTAFLLPFGAYALLSPAGLLGTKPETTFLFITDTHGPAADNVKLVQAMLRESNVNFVIHGGDIADTEDLWRAWWDTPFSQVIAKWPVYPTRGNHDPEAGYRQRFPNSWPPYKLSFGSVDIFFVPYLSVPAANGSTGAAVANWLQRETAFHSAPFKILVTHRPIWRAQGSEGDNLATLFAASLPRIDLILAGHNHVFQDSSRVIGDRIVRQVIEKSGPKNYTCNSGAAGCVERSTGYLRVTVSADQISVERRQVGL